MSAPLAAKPARTSAVLLVGVPWATKLRPAPFWWLSSSDATSAAADSGVCVQSTPRTIRRSMRPLILAPFFRSAAVIVIAMPAATAAG